MSEVNEVSQIMDPTENIPSSQSPEVPSVVQESGKVDSTLQKLESISDEIQEIKDEIESKNSTSKIYSAQTEIKDEEGKGNYPKSLDSIKEAANYLGKFVQVANESVILYSLNKDGIVEDPTRSLSQFK